MFSTTLILSEAPTTKMYINMIINQEACVAHSAHKCEPCWVLESSTEGKLLPAICHQRFMRVANNMRNNNESKLPNGKRGGLVDAVSEKRELLKKAYRSKKWADKVDRMPEDQVVAVFLRLKSQNKI